MRRAFAGLLWSQQFYHYDVESWLDGDAAQPTPPTARRRGRNATWRHLDSNDVLVMPDKWEYPWYAAWDLGPWRTTSSAASSASSFPTAAAAGPSGGRPRSSRRIPPGAT